MITVHHVPTHFVHKEWPLVAPFLEAALTHSEASGEITLDQLRADLGQNRGALYTVVKDGLLVGAASVTFQNQRNARVAFISCIGGKGLQSRQVFNQLFELFRRNGATRAAGAVRDSMVRWGARVGFKKKFTVVEAEL
jgi:hypothetical protein